MANRWIWISGWAINPDRFRAAAEAALPDDVHEVLAPTPDALEAVCKSDADRIGGYSLGSLILLSALEQLTEKTPITCLAPFISFCKEDGAGGTTLLATLHALQQRLRVKPLKALQLFYRLAGLNDEPSDELPYSVDDLAWGLEQLGTLKANPTLLDQVTAIAGQGDLLIDSQKMGHQWTNCRFVEQCGHDYRTLLSKMIYTEY